MKVDANKFMRDGFVVLKGVIPPERLGELRDSYEILVERQRALSVSEWESASIPTVSVAGVVDRETANTVEFFLHEHTLGVSRQLLGVREVAVLLLQVLCNPVKDMGPGSWHRDLKPNYQAPLCGLQADILANGPTYVQWNIALYDDDNLCVVPGSHARTITEEETRQLLDDPRAPLTNCIHVDLKAGDGVAYTGWLLHRGARYGPKLRRTIHPVYRSFGGNNLPNNLFFHWDPEFTRCFPTECREAFERYLRLGCQERDVIASVFRSVIEKDRVGFESGLAALHPGETGRVVCVVLLSKIAYRIWRLKNPGLVQQFPSERKVDFDPAAGAVKRSTAHLPAQPKEPPLLKPQFNDLAQRFSCEELEMLWNRFTTLDAKLKSDEEQFCPGFQFGPTPYRFHEMPDAFDVEEFIASWND